VAGLQHHPDLGRIRFQGRDLGDELVDGCRAVLHPQDLDHPLVGVSQGDEVKASAQSIPIPSTMPALQDHR
jgi:hypothetical protein